MMAKEVSKALAKRTFEVVSFLLPNGKKQGHEYCVGNVYGASGDSLKIHLEGEKAGVWCDFATGEGGDLLDLWVNSRSITLPEALTQACDYLGIKPTPLAGKKPEKFKRPAALPAQREDYNSPVHQYLMTERKLTSETLSRFKIGERNGEIIFPSYRNGDLISVKYMKLKRDNGKKVMYVEKDCEPSLFGWQAIPDKARKIVICEGEIDAMSLYQYGLPALSVPFGAGTGRKHEWVEYEFDRLSMFDEIYICMDNDDEGKKASEEIIARLGPHRCLMVALPMKDASECLKIGLKPHDMEYLFSQAISIDPKELKGAY